VTDWFYGYQTAVKGAVKALSQSFDGELEIICLQGGFITQVEAAEMPRIMAEAKRDCAQSDVTVKYTITEMSYYDFLSEYEPMATDLEQPKPDPELLTHGDIRHEQLLAKKDADASAEGIPPIIDASARAKQLKKFKALAAENSSNSAAKLAAVEKELAEKKKEMGEWEELVLEEMATLGYVVCSICIFVAVLVSRCVATCACTEMRRGC
jgi:hypothetical protein